MGPPYFIFIAYDPPPPPDFSTCLYFYLGDASLQLFFMRPLVFIMGPLLLNMRPPSFILLSYEAPLILTHVTTSLSEAPFNFFMMPPCFYHMAYVAHYEAPSFILISHETPLIHLSLLFSRRPLLQLLLWDPFVFTMRPTLLIMRPP